MLKQFAKYRSRSIPKRYFSTTEKGIVEEVSTIETKGKDGRTFLKKINVVTQWNNMSSTKKKVIGAYATISGLCYVAYTYNDGKSALIKHRQDCKNKNGCEDEWLAVKDGCSKNSCDNFWNSLFFPWKFTTQSIPYLILSLNPKGGQRSAD
jgi:hypothetical protein